MRKKMSVAASVLFCAAGALLIVLGAMSGTVKVEGSRYVVVLALVGSAIVLGVTSFITARIVDEEYRRYFGSVSFLLCAGLIALATFFGAGSTFIPEGTYGVLLAVFLVCYGIAMITCAFVNLVLSQSDYRVFVFDLVRQAPHLYYRYRT